jgi:hypothetical protein
MDESGRNHVFQDRREGAARPARILIVTRTPIRKWPIALVAAVALISGTGCGKAPAGPLQTSDSQGQPYVGMAWSLVRPDESPDAEAYVFNSADGPVQITGVTAVPVTDEPAGRLVHVGLPPAGADVAAGGGWPPGTPVTPFVGAEIPHGLTGISFAMANSAADHYYYAVAGLRIEYEYHGQAYSTVAWDGEAACVYGGGNRAADWASCTAFGNQVRAIVEDMSGLS